MIRVALIQMDIELGKPEINLHRGIDFIYHAVDLGSDIILLPELFTTGFSSNLKDLSEDIEGRTVKALMEICRKENVTITGSFPEKSGDGIYNSMPVITPDGVIGIYRKIHLFGGMNEQNYFRPGSDVKVFRTSLGNLGCMICYDIRFPELARKITLLGADVILISAEFPHPRLNHWKILLKARAIENQLFVCAVNRVGKDNENSFFGHSMVVSPWGDVIVEGREKEEILIADLDLDEVVDARKSLPVLEDRREDVYDQ